MSLDFKNIPQPETLIASTSSDVAYKKLHRTELTKIPVRAFFLDDVLSREECLHYIKETEAAGYSDLVSEYPTAFRDNDRLLGLSEIGAHAIFERVLPSMNAADFYHQPVGTGSRGVWLPYGLNECFRFGRTTEGCRFKAHLDGPWCPDPSQCSIYTILIYLNDEQTEAPYGFVGGDTNFLQDDGQHLDQNKSYEVLCRVRPKMGGALIFKHETLHEGAPVTEGAKYILRTEIMFYRTESAIDSFLYKTDETVDQTVGSLYDASATELERNGDALTSYQLFTRALQLQAESSAANKTEESVLAHLSSQTSINSLLKPADVGSLIEILQWLSVTDLRCLMQVSVSMYRAARSNSLWLTHCRAQYSDALLSRVIDARFHLAYDWYSFLKRGRRALRLLGLDATLAATCALNSKLSSELQLHGLSNANIGARRYTNSAQFPVFAQAFERVECVLLDLGSWSTKCGLVHKPLEDVVVENSLIGTGWVGTHGMHSFCISVGNNATATRNDYRTTIHLFNPTMEESNEKLYELADKNSNAKHSYARQDQLASLLREGGITGKTEAYNKFFSVCYLRMGITPTNYPALLAVSPDVLNSKELSREYRQYGYNFGIQSVGLVSKTLLALLSYNAYSGIVVDFGQVKTTIEIYRHSTVVASETFPGTLELLYNGGPAYYADLESLVAIQTCWTSYVDNPWCSLGRWSQKKNFYSEALLAMVTWIDTAVAKMKPAHQADVLHIYLSGGILNQPYVRSLFTKMLSETQLPELYWSLTTRLDKKDACWLGRLPDDILQILKSQLSFVSCHPDAAMATWLGGKVLMQGPAAQKLFQESPETQETQNYTSSHPKSVKGLIDRYTKKDKSKDSKQNTNSAASQKKEIKKGKEKKGKK